MRVITICLNPAIDVSSVADSIQPVRKIRTHQQCIEPGGGGVNVARALHSFGLNPKLIYLSGGSAGKLLDDCIDACNVDYQRFQIEGETRIAFNVHHAVTGQEYRFVPDGPAANGKVLDSVLEYLRSLQLNPQDIVVASGSIPGAIPTRSYAAIANETPARFVLDSSGEALSVALQRCTPYLVKPSLGELENLAGTTLDEQSAQAFSMHMIDAGNADNIAVSMGIHGAFLARKEGILRLPSHMVKVESAVGAGDSFVAGMVFSICGGGDIETAFKYGVAAGAAAVMTEGSQLCRPEDADTLFSHTHTEYNVSSM